MMKSGERGKSAAMACFLGWLIETGMHTWLEEWWCSIKRAADADWQRVRTLFQIAGPDPTGGLPVPQLS
jgi:hypothetical protein